MWTRCYLSLCSLLALRVLALVLVLGLLPGSVMAAWPSFRGNGSNMGITDVQTPAPDYAKLQWAAKIGTSAEGMTTSTVYAGQPVVEGEFVYATAGRTLYKIKALDGNVAVQQVMDGKDRFGTIPPTIAGDTIYVALDGGMVEAFNKDTLAKKWTLGGLSAGGQNSCPVLVSEGRVYTGFYDSETGTQNYVCLTTAGKRVWSYANAGGFYWAGAVAVGDYIFVGTDDGAESGVNGTSRILSFRKAETRESRAQHGLRRTLLANCIEGVTKGFSKTLEVIGVGYRVAVKGNVIELQVGFSHPVLVELPAGLSAKVEGQKLTIMGADKVLVGEMAARIRRIRKPEPYKGKGIKYETETILRKAGKSGGKGK